MDIDDDLEPLPYCSYEVSPALDELIKFILKTIPDEHTYEFPSFSVFEHDSSWIAHVDDGRIICSPSLLNMPRHVAIGILAHEFAHVFLGHTGEGGLENEYEADKLASEWGFAAEVKMMRERLGPPTIE